jgi:cardiolipin synthase
MDLIPEEFGWLWAAIAAAGGVGAVIFIVLERRRPAATLAWILVLLLLPVVGLPVYLLIGRRRVRRARRKRRMEVVKPMDAMRRLRAVDKVPTELPEEVGGLVRLAQRTSLAAVRRADHVELFVEMDTAFEAMWDAIDAAKHRIHLEFYIWRADRTGSEMIRRLTAAAERGVRVRVLYDAVGSVGLSRDHFSSLVAQGGEVAAFAPLSPLRWTLRRNTRLDFRNHRKLVCIDGSIGFAGGLNVGDEYRERPSESSEVEWRDLWMRIDGDLVLGLEAVFLEDWQATTGVLVQPWEGVQGQDDIDLADEPREDCASTGPAGQIIASGPEFLESSAIVAQFISAIAIAQRRCWICTPYFIPESTLVILLRIAALRGVDVRICVPGRDHNDAPLVGMAARSYYDGLLESGCQIYEYDQGMLHAKYLIVDEHVATVGSANFDLRSLHINYEVTVMFYDAGLTTRLAQVFEDTLVHASRVLPESRAKLGLPMRLAEGMARIMSPLF